LSYETAFASEGGLRYNQNIIAVGAQTVRRGDAWPVRGLLGGKDLTGRFFYDSDSTPRLEQDKQKARLGD
jgi:hypothetical protein